MGIIGFNFTKFSAERRENVGGKVNIKNNLSVQNVEKEDSRILAGDAVGLKVSFEFTSTYEPDLGKISIEANVIALEEKEPGEKILKEWEETKKLPDEFMETALNFMLRRCNIKALIFSEDLNLPLPIQLPTVSRNPPAKE
jgi:hypothetical protein